MQLTHSSLCAEYLHCTEQVHQAVSVLGNITAGKGVNVYGCCVYLVADMSYYVATTTAELLELGVKARHAFPLQHAHTLCPFQ